MHLCQWEKYTCYILLPVIKLMWNMQNKTKLGSMWFFLRLRQIETLKAKCLVTMLGLENKQKCKVLLV